jgi:hypothetical protein
MNKSYHLMYAPIMYATGLTGGRASFSGIRLNPLLCFVITHLHYIYQYPDIILLHKLDKYYG